MNLKFKAQAFQTDTVAAVVDLFCGKEKRQDIFTIINEKQFKYKKKFYEAGLIHKTARGELVRSKSEVIIADALLVGGIDYYEYEKELDLGEDRKKALISPLMMSRVVLLFIGNTAS